MDNSMKSGEFTMMKMLLIFGLLPLLVTSVLLVSVGYGRIKKEVTDAVIDKIAASNKQFNQYCYDWYNDEGEEVFLARIRIMHMLMLLKRKISNLQYLSGIPEQ